MKKDWEIKKLGEVCDIYQPKTISKKLMLVDGEYPVFGANGIIGKYDKYNHELPQLLVTCRGATCGSVNISLPKSWINGNAMVIRPTNDDLLLKFVEYFFKGYVNLSSIITGAAQPQITRKNLSPVKIPIPPLKEQKQIVAILDKAFAAIATAKQNAEQNLINAKQLFESYLQNIFENKGDDWVEKTLGEVCSLYQGLAINRKTKHFLVEKSNLPLLRIKDLRKNTAEQYVDENNYPKNSLVNKDDIIYTRTGNSLGLVFRGRYGILHNNSFKIIPDDLLSRDYLFIWLQNPLFKSKIFGLAFKAAQPDITHKIFKLQSIKIPPIKEQQHIVKKLNNLSAQTKKLEIIYQKKIEDLEELKKSILQKAFNGALTH